MKFHIITIFPEAFESFVSCSIIGRAITNGQAEITYYKLNDFAKDSSGHVDDKAYGMHGQVLSPVPLGRAIEHIFATVEKKIPVVYFSPRGMLLHQEQVEKYSQSLTECILICGHYEGIDERIIELYVDQQICIGEYILSGGELPAQVFMDAMIRHIPGVLGNPESLKEESFGEKLGRQKEYPLYTRPSTYQDLAVPEVLRSGNHAEIEKWKHHKLS